MRVGIDGWYLQVPRGIGNTTRDLLLALSSVSQPDEYLVYVPRGFAPDAALKRLANVRLRTLPRLPYPMWEQALLPIAASYDGVDVLHCVGNTAPLCASRRIKLVLTLHDAMFMLPASALGGTSSIYQRLGRIYRRYVATRAATRAAQIVTNSAATRREVVARLGAPGGKVRVLAFAQGDDFRPLAPIERRRDLPQRAAASGAFILGFAARDPRKNTRRLVSAFMRVADRCPGVDLVLVGGGDDPADLPGISSDVRSRIVLLGFVRREQLIALYNAALAVVYPSLYEGFGLPVLEAMACGTPVVTSLREALIEVAGGAAVLVDPENTDEIAQAISRLVVDDHLRDSLRTLGLAHAAQFSWSAAAEQLASLYRTL